MYFSKKGYSNNNDNNNNNNTISVKHSRYLDLGHPVS